MWGRAPVTKAPLPEPFDAVRHLDPEGGRAVWLLRDTLLDRLVVGKHLPHGARPTRGEAACSRVAHPIPATLFGVQPDGRGGHWLLSEYVDGVPLAAMRQPMDAPTALALLTDLASALLAFEAAGVAHGDLAPGNLLVNPSGRLRIIDYGNATCFGDAASGAGTPGFAAPESVARLSVSAATDRWSVAALGVWLLAGQPPGWLQQDGRRHLSMPAWRPPDSVTERLWDILRSGLAISPLQRPEGADWFQRLSRLQPLYGEDGRAPLSVLVGAMADPRQP